MERRYNVTFDLSFMHLQRGFRPTIGFMDLFSFFYIKKVLSRNTSYLKPTEYLYGCSWETHFKQYNFNAC